MYLTKMKIKNFRGYKDETEINFGDITALVGKNDSGKSTILEALEIFLNDNSGIVKIDANDVNITNREDGNTETVISLSFKDLPEKLILDTTYATTLQQEYLLNQDGELEVVKKFKNGSSKHNTYIKAYYPSNEKCADLILKKNTELKKLIDQFKIQDVDKNKNADMRQAIYAYFADDLELKNQEIDVSQNEIKNIWAKLSTYLPIYSLFQSDRKNVDSDSEVQDPLKNAVKELLKDQEIQENLDRIAKQVTEKLKEVAEKTVEKLKDMDPALAKELKPSIPESGALKWADVFKNVSISGDEGIPINKRGSGVRRLILLNFFRAEADRKLKEQKSSNSSASVIYAIEEPETSQHFRNQVTLINAFKELAKSKKIQLMITTHSGIIVKQLKFENIRIIDSEDKLNIKVKDAEPNCLPYPSLNEINYLAFEEITEEYHNELYGFLEENDLMNDYEKDKKRRKYIQVDQKKKQTEKQYTLTRIVRHQIHHPENKLNPHFSAEDLAESIVEMRNFIIRNRDNNKLD